MSACVTQTNSNSGDSDPQESLGRTELNIIQDGLPDIIPPEACYLGWQESLRNLVRLVEPEITQEGGRQLRKGISRTSDLVLVEATPFVGERIDYLRGYVGLLFKP